MTDPLVLALDMGTSSVRAMLFDHRGRAVPEREAQLGYAYSMTADGGVETDADILVARTVECVRQTLALCPKKEKRRIIGVGVSCFWHSIVGVGKDNRAVTPLYSWADTRSARYVPELAKLVNGPKYHSVTGAELHPCFWPSKLLWLQAERRQQFDLAAKWMSFGEYLELKLFGFARCSVSMASGTGLFHQNKCDWDNSLFSVLPIRREQLNIVVDRQEPLSGMSAPFAGALPELADVPWFPALGDGACSNVGCGAVGETRLAINIGTSGAIRVMVPAATMDIRAGLFCYRMDRNNFVSGGAFANGGNVYAWEHASLLLQGRKAASRRVSTMPPDSHGLTILPFFAGERTPGWNLNARATVTGINLHTTPFDIVRASLEAVAYSIDGTRQLLHQNFPHIKEVVASGGALVHDPMWVQIMADVFNQPVITSKVFEASSRGAALLALQSLGLITNLAEMPSYLGKTYTPDPARAEIYRRGKARYDALYSVMFPVSKRKSAAKTQGSK